MGLCRPLVSTVEIAPFPSSNICSGWKIVLEYANLVPSGQILDPAQAFPRSLLLGLCFEETVSCQLAIYTKTEGKQQQLGEMLECGTNIYLFHLYPTFLSKAKQLTKTKFSHTKQLTKHQTAMRQYFYITIILNILNITTNTQ